MMTPRERNQVTSVERAPRKRGSGSDGVQGNRTVYLACKNMQHLLCSPIDPISTFCCKRNDSYHSGIFGTDHECYATKEPFDFRRAAC